MKHTGELETVSVSEEEHAQIQARIAADRARFGVVNPCWMLCCNKESGHDGPHGNPSVQ